MLLARGGGNGMSQVWDGGKEETGVLTGALFKKVREWHANAIYQFSDDFVSIRNELFSNGITSCKQINAASQHSKRFNINP